MNIIDALLLGILQGLTEFLPISSSGHLVLAKELFNLDTSGNIAFDVFVHFGTLISVLILFWKDVRIILLSLLQALKNPLRLHILFKENEHFKIAIFILLASIPAGIVGVAYDDEIETLFSDAKFVSVMLLITGAILYITKFAKPPEDAKVGFWSAILIGITQAIAILPGISRSGITISSGIFSGVSRANAAKFSFLLSLPVIFGATVLQSVEVVKNETSFTMYLIYLSGMFSAALSGYIAMKFVINILKKKRFFWFSFYCFIIGILGILFIG